MVYMTDSTRNVWWNEGAVLDAWDSSGVQTLKEGTGHEWLSANDEQGRTLSRYSAGLLNGPREHYDHAERLREIDCHDHGDWTGRVIYFNNGTRYTDYDCFNAPWWWKNEEILWWYNGRLRRYDNGDSVVEYHPNGQLRSIGYYPPKDSTIVIDPNKAYVLKGYTLAGHTWRDDNRTTEEALDEDGVSVSFSGSISGHPDDWVRTYYADGTLGSQVDWCDSCACLVRTEYYLSGKLHRTGCVHYGNIRFTPSESDGDDSFTGYHRAGQWKVFSAQGEALNMVNMDERPIDERRILNFSTYGD